MHAPLGIKIRSFFTVPTAFCMSDSTVHHPPAEPLPGVLDGPRTSTVIAPRSSTAAGVARRRVPLVLKLTLLVGITLALLVAVMVVANGVFWQGVVRKTVNNHLSSMAASRRDMVNAQVAQLRQRVELNTDRGELRGFFNDWELLWDYEGPSRDPAHRRPVAEIAARRGVSQVR